MIDSVSLVPRLKVDLGIVTTAYDERLEQYLTNAKKMITEQGVTLEDTDAELVVLYAAWMWRRRDTMEGMPRMLRYALNCRVFGEKMKDG